MTSHNSGGSADDDETFLRVTAKEKATLHDYLRNSRAALLGKLDGLSGYDARRPMVPTGTNLLGLVKHASFVEAGYLGETFGRPFVSTVARPIDEAEPGSDLWATADQSQDSIVIIYQEVWGHSDRTIAELSLDAVGHVPWWPAEQNDVTLHRVLVHLVAENNRHAGHADILRELIDGVVGLRKPGDNVAVADPVWWKERRDRLDRIARDAGSG